jgi:hypothetical protein
MACISNMSKRATGKRIFIERNLFCSLFSLRKSALRTAFEKKQTAFPSTVWLWRERTHTCPSPGRDHKYFPNLEAGGSDEKVMLWLSLTNECEQGTQASRLLVQ